MRPNRHDVAGKNDLMCWRPRINALLIFLPTGLPIFFLNNSVFQLCLTRLFASAKPPEGSDALGGRGWHFSPITLTGTPPQGFLRFRETAQSGRRNSAINWLQLYDSRCVNRSPENRRGTNKHADRVTREQSSGNLKASQKRHHLNEKQNAKTE